MCYKVFALDRLGADTWTFGFCWSYILEISVPLFLTESALTNVVKARSALVTLGPDMRVSTAVKMSQTNWHRNSCCTRRGADR